MVLRTLMPQAACTDAVWQDQNQILPLRTSKATEDQKGEAETKTPHKYTALCEHTCLVHWKGKIIDTGRGDAWRGERERDGEGGRICLFSILSSFQMPVSITYCCCPLFSLDFSFSSVIIYNWNITVLLRYKKFSIIACIITFVR